MSGLLFCMFFRKECFLQMPHDALKGLSLTARGISLVFMFEGVFAL